MRHVYVERFEEESSDVYYIYFALLPKNVRVCQIHFLPSILILYNKIL